MSHIILSGSLAYDYIMDFPDSFKNHILPDQIHILNVCFVVEKLEKNFGGTAGNIAYTMALLGGSPVIVSSVGKDGKEYIERLTMLGIETGGVVQSQERMTASAYITTDKDDNQVTAFYPGTLDEAPSLSAFSEKSEATFAIIGPTNKTIMLRHAKECHDSRIPFVFDPGQQITALNPQELMQAIGQAAFLIGNDYEMKMIEQKTGWDTRALLDHVDVVIVTMGERGSVVVTKDQTYEIEAVKPRSVDDPTGAGDAYRAGFFLAYSRGNNFETCGRVGSVAAAYAIEHYGTQHHTFAQNEFVERYERAYGGTLDWTYQ
ncbi:MAG TPA: carbohydrate kinase family protein [Candidatus Magasanikbacteria bacterium]|nr:MAG: hypothetical protein A3I74_02355 [Candidatus Magasanikbacteria bacterium RIFCSPLOWO2_02_FULL_47_16]OGH79649.1 MAG: hypothetical protein A3C10_01045 [Candidatus Magasanikbacteria bacterium RIFCSPHIGHO2_02_FULL_48_18]OGH83129.1 MAG: hypothetical protein A3G08_00110 [Candidatus Magasanikbacteria bacterium RIFCSPLOWO2_12_FULL_47_9b]HAZ28294.1 carbohydrate kinase family protein [Candidatus Magasanikbacteria bacterium]